MRGEFVETITAWRQILPYVTYLPIFFIALTLCLQRNEQPNEYKANERSDITQTNKWSKVQTEDGAQAAKGSLSNNGNNVE